MAKLTASAAVTVMLPVRLAPLAVKLEPALGVPCVAMSTGTVAGVAVMDGPKEDG